MTTTQLLNRTDPEKTLFTVQNQEGAQLTNGMLVEWDLDNTEGIDVEKTDSVAANLVCGVVVDTIDTGGIGRAQRWGYHSAVLTTTTVTAGTIVQADTSGKCRNFATTSTDISATTQSEAYSIIGVCGIVTDTNSSGIFLRL